MSANGQESVYVTMPNGDSLLVNRDDPEAMWFALKELEKQENSESEAEVSLNVTGLPLIILMIGLGVLGFIGLIAVIGYAKAQLYKHLL